MLKQQLEELQKNRKSIFAKQKYAISFVDETLDIGTVCSLITISNKYLTLRYLSFERDLLSEAENGRFDTKFAPFITSLLKHNEDPGFGYALEYLVRVFRAEKYNTKELFFLLLPFRRYLKQINQLGNVLFNGSFYMESYSCSYISRFLLHGSFLFNEFVKYFDFYTSSAELQYFLDSVMQAYIGLTEDFAYPGEIYEIFKKLIASGFSSKAVQWYQMLWFLKSPEFDSLLGEALSSDEDNKVNKMPKTSRYEKIWYNKQGRALLGSASELHEYIEYLEKHNKTPEEFTEPEFFLLKDWHKGNKAVMTDTAAAEALFVEICDREWLLSALLNDMTQDRWNKIRGYCKDKEHLLILRSIPYSKFLQENILSILQDILVNGNVIFILRNMDKNTLSTHYTNIAKLCFSFPACPVEFFKKPLKFTPSSNIQASNLIRHYQLSDQDALSEILSCDLRFPSQILYLLRSDTSYDLSLTETLLRRVKEIGDPAIVIEASLYMCRNDITVLALSFIDWVRSKGLITTSLPLFLKYRKDLTTECIYEAFLVAENDFGCNEAWVKLFEELKYRNFDIIGALYLKHKYSLIFNICQRFGLDAIFIDHPLVPHFIQEYKDALNGDMVVSKILERIDNESYLELLPIFETSLIHYRNSTYWDVLSIIVIEGLDSQKKAQDYLDYILNCIQDFTNDIALFDKIFMYSQHISLSNIKQIIPYGKPSADLIESALMHNALDILPALPFIAPLLISHQRHIVSRLFSSYPKIMSCYASDILTKFPDAVKNLEMCFPRDSLLAFSRVLYSSLSNSSLEVLNNILTTQKSPSLSLSERLCNWIDLALVDSAFYINFLSFFVSSHPNTPSQIASRLILSAVSSLKVGLADSASFCLLVRVNPFIFCDAFSYSLRKSVDEFLFLPSFVTECIRISVNPSAIESIGKGHYALSKRLFEKYGLNASYIVSVLCSDSPAILPDLLNFLVDYARGGSIEAATLVKTILENVNEAKEYKNTLESHFVFLSESANQPLALASQQVCEVLQHIL